MNRRTFFRDNGLSFILFGFFLLFLLGQTLTGYAENNQDQARHGQPLLSLGAYLVSSHYWEAVFENWESEFLQMAAYVVLTVFLFQKGSAESKDPDKSGNVDEDPRSYRRGAQVPMPVRKGGWRLILYEHSLSLALGTLFLCSFVGHLISGHRHYNDTLSEHGETSVSILGYLGSCRFWFESFQNWQSEFLAVFAIVFLSIWLREKGSPESKPVAAPHHATGD